MVMFGLFKKQTIDDPKFGSLLKKGSAWTGTVRTPLFPEIDLAISIRARDEKEFEVCRGHLEQVISNSATIRSHIASQALETYHMYQAEEGDKEPYAEIISEEGIWPLIKPQEWLFQPGQKEFTSQVVIDFGWPNPHYLVAYLADTDLYLLDVDG
jgi:hypothetical protein